MALDPVTLGAIISAGGALGSAGLGAMASGANADTIAALNARSIQSQERENFLRRVLADRLLNIQLQGGEDAFGNATRFIPGRGFVVELDPRVQQIQNASLREQLMRTTRDADIRREGLEANAVRRREEGAIANTLRDRFVRELQDPHTNESDLFRLLLASGQGAAQQESDRILQQVLRQNLRAGGSSSAAANILSQFANDAATRRQDAAVSARLAAITGAEDINNTRLGNRSNLMNLFATRASNFADVPFAPEQLSAGATGFGNAQRQGALGASQIAGGLGATAGARPVFEPSADFGAALALGSGADALSGLFEVLAQRERDKAPTGRQLGSQFSGAF